MALRVLLADESSTIKKVIQLSLQDFDVDVKSVTIGLDVLSVTKTFRPDVVLADVLLAKRSGYEVCHDLKNDPETSHIPVVLIWSGFMEIDEQKARLCGADRRLEKPFDASTLRQIVHELVSKTQDNPASSFLQFPPLPPFEEQRSAATPAQPAAPSFPGIPAQKPQTATPPISIQVGDEDNGLVIDDSDSETADEWVQQPIAPKSNNTSQSMASKSNAPLAKEDEFTEYPLTQAPVKPASTPLTKQPLHERVVTAPHMQAPPAQQAATALSQAMPQISEELAREEVQKWLSKNMPDIAERLIREEINRLLQESEKTIQGP